MDELVEYVPRGKRWGRKPGHYKKGMFWDAFKPTNLRRQLRHLQTIKPGSSVRRLRYAVESPFRSILPVFRFMEGTEAEEMKRRLDSLGKSLEALRVPEDDEPSLRDLNRRLKEVEVRLTSPFGPILQGKD